MHFGTFARACPNLGCTPGSIHATQNASSNPVPVVGHGLEGKPTSPVTHEEVDSGAVDLGVDIYVRGARVLDRVDDRLSGGLDECTQGAIVLAVTHRDEVYWYAV
ncbi:MAG: hypothetical protein QM747_17880 [Nocardioides sp.]